MKSPQASRDRQTRRWSTTISGGPASSTWCYQCCVSWAYEKRRGAPDTVPLRFMPLSVVGHCRGQTRLTVTSLQPGASGRADRDYPAYRKGSFEPQTSRETRMGL